MEYQDNLGSYRNFSRKKLQELCKKKNLPANRSAAQLAKSLASFSKSKVVHSAPSKMCSSDTTELISYYSCLPGTKLKDGTPFSEEEAVIGAYEKSVSSSESDTYKMLPVMEENGCVIKQHCQIEDQLGNCDFTNHQTLNTAHDTGTIAIYPHKFNNGTYGLDWCLPVHGDMSVKSLVAGDTQHASVDLQLGHWGYDSSINVSKSDELLLANITGDVEAHLLSSRHPRLLKSPVEVGYASSYDSYTKAASSLDFFVMSDDGISLYVDLNSSTSEWIQKLKDEVCINQKIEPQSLGPLTNHMSDGFDVDVQMNPLQPEDILLNLQKEADRGTGFANSSFGSVFSWTCPQVYPLDATLASSVSSILTSSSNPIDMCNQVVSPRTAYSNSQNLMTTDNTSTHHKRSMSLESSYDNPSRMEHSNTRHGDTEISIAHNSVSTVLVENNVLKSDVSLKNVNDSDVISETRMYVGNKSSSEIESRCSFLFDSCHEKSPGSCQVGGQLNLNSVADLCQSHSNILTDYLPKDSDSCFCENLVKNVADLKKDRLECSAFQNSSVKISKRSCNPEFDGVILNNKKRRSDRNSKNGYLCRMLSSSKEYAIDRATPPRRSSRFLSK